MANAPGDTPLVLVLAGAGYGQQAPLLWWTDAVARQAGCTVVAPRWTVDDVAETDPARFVVQALTVALAGRRPDLVVAKSFGCAGLRWAVDQGVPGVWLTPVLTDDAVCAALLAAGDAHVALGGSADPVWRPERARGTRASLQTVDRADHRLEVPGDWRASQRLQTEVLSVVEERIAVATSATR